MQPDLRTPSILYNHGGYYAPAVCTMPSGPCSACSQERCPACGKAETYRSHSDLGYLSPCHGCEPKICTECAHGARYTCAYFQARLQQPSAPLERQLTEDRWREAELYMTEHQDIGVFEVARFEKHVYILVRLSTGRIVRVHLEDEM